MYMGVTKKSVYTVYFLPWNCHEMLWWSSIFLEVFYFRTPYFQDLEQSIGSNLEPRSRGWILESPVGTKCLIQLVQSTEDDKVQFGRRHGEQEKPHHGISMHLNCGFKMSNIWMKTIQKTSNPAVACLFGYT